VDTKEDNKDTDLTKVVMVEAKIMEVKEDMAEAKIMEAKVATDLTKVDTEETKVDMVNKEA